MQQDALLREYRSDLTIEKIVEMADSDLMDEFF